MESRRLVGPSGSSAWVTVQVLQQMQDIPLNLTVLSPGHTPNWDLMSDVVNAVSRIYRSPKQCKDRYETVIVPREEGKILYDTNPKKQKKTKGIYKVGVPLFLAACAPMLNLTSDLPPGKCRKSEWEKKKKLGP